MIGALLDTVEASFVPTPAAAISRGDDWQSAHVLQAVDGSVAMTFEGLFHHKKRGEPMALLTVAYDEERQTTTSTGTETRGRKGEARVLYATDGGYVAEIDRELIAFAPSRGMSYEKLRVTWQLVRGMMPTEMVSPTDDLQVISDPCNLDYVGPDACPTQLQPLPDPAVETGNGVEPKADAPKADAPKADAPKADAPKADAPKANAASSPGG
ncbi:MAG: hypothetical protein JKY37_17290 [Nannocystaceae bacterium]|nr:hypothetical protein [Nannocystaceae bacterium]